MKKPFTLLCLSDCHLEEKSQNEQKSELDSLSKLIEQITENNPIWRPDFLVVAGDLKKAEENFDSASKIVNSLLRELHLEETKFIAVPGNHDKIFPKNIPKGEQDRINKFYDTKAVEKEKKKEEEGKKEEEQYFAQYFNLFNDFYKKYGCDTESDEIDFEFKFNSTSFLKVFHNPEVCFLGINTEIGYYPKETRIGLELYLYPPVVYPLLKKIRLKYPDYTVVTVMHRDPRQLSWEDRAKLPDHGNPELLKILYSMSDLILTGHDHVEQILPPDMMANRSQLFKLGSASMKARNKDVVAQHRAYLLNIDPIHNYLSFKVLGDNGNLNQGPLWTEIYEGRYHIQDKSQPEYSDSDSSQYGSIRRIRAKSSKEEDIISALLPGIHGEYKLECIQQGDVGKLDVTSFSQKTILYIYDFLLNGTDYYDIVRKLSDTVENFKNDNRDKIISMTIIVSCVLVEVPFWDTTRENWNWPETGSSII